jgi:hypothetical protein
LARGALVTTAREPASVGEVEQRGDAGDRPDVAEAVAIGGLLGGQRLLAQIVRQMRQKFLPDHLVRGAHDAGDIFGAIEPDPMRREGTLKGDEMLGVGIDERAVEIEEKG